MFVEIVILLLTKYKAEPHHMQKTGGLAVFAYCILYYYTFIKNYERNFVTIWDSFQIMLPGGRDSGSFLWKNIGLG